MWERNKENRFELKRHHLSLFSYLPELHRVPSFAFSDDMSFSWSHNWAHEYSEFKFDKIFLFARDPRDALFSQYRRISYPGDYEDFLKVPQLPFLLNPIDSWKWFHRIWLSCPDISILQFENFKREPFDSTDKFLRDLNLQFSQSQIEYAIESSRIENAKKAQEAYMKMNLDEKLSYTVIHSGKPKEWQLDGNRKAQNDKIIRECHSEMTRLGYVDALMWTEGENLRAKPNLNKDITFTAMSYRRVFDFFDDSEKILNWNILIPIIRKSLLVKEVALTKDLLVACLHRARKQNKISKLAILNVLYILLLVTNVYIASKNLWRKIKGFVKFRLTQWSR